MHFTTSLHCYCAEIIVINHMLTMQLNKNSTMPVDNRVDCLIRATIRADDVIVFCK